MEKNSSQFYTLTMAALLGIVCMVYVKKLNQSQPQIRAENERPNNTQSDVKNTRAVKGNQIERNNVPQPIQSDLKTHPERAKNYNQIHSTDQNSAQKSQKVSARNLQNSRKTKNIGAKYSKSQRRTSGSTRY